MTKTINTLIKTNIIADLLIGEMINLSGYIYTSLAAVLPKIVSLIQSGKLEEYDIKLERRS